MATYRITLSNSAGELDAANTTETLSIIDVIIDMLSGVPLQDGDVIRITEVK